MMQEEKELVIARLQTFPSNLRISMGKSYSGAELIKEVEGETEVGEKIVQIEMEYLKALSDGTLLNEVIEK